MFICVEVHIDNQLSVGNFCYWQPVVKCYRLRYINCDFILTVHIFSDSIGDGVKKEAVTYENALKNIGRYTQPGRLAK